MDRQCKQVLKFAILVALGGVAAWFGSVFNVVHATNPATVLWLLAAALWLDAIRTAGRMSADKKEIGNIR